MTLLKTELGCLLSYEQKLEALQALGEVALRMRKPVDWYVATSMEIGGDGMLHGAYGKGPTPQDAVVDHWRQYVDELPEGRYIVLGGNSDARRSVRWNGFMWADVPKPVTA